MCSWEGSITGRVGTLDVAVVAVVVVAIPVWLLEQEPAPLSGPSGKW
jgi:hypothetical protein